MAPAKLHLHLVMVFVGGGIGKDLNLVGRTKTKIPVTLAVQSKPRHLAMPSC